MKVSVIMPVERTGGDAERAIASVLNQEAPFPFELIVVSAALLELPPDTRVRNVVEVNRNPATRRNRAASVAQGEFLAFIDDDAFADPQWLANAAVVFGEHPEALAVGGPDPAPYDSPVEEMISDTLLATPLIGSGIAAHENRRGSFYVKSPSDVALVNLIVRRDAFSGFDESIGYIGEDTALIEDLMKRGKVLYDDRVRVFHRRRAFPGPYLRQRWRYRVKTGERLASGSKTHEGKVQTFLLAGTLAIIFAPIAVVPYFLGTFVLGASTTHLPPRYWLMLPFAFAAHHLTYFAGICWGLLRGSTLRRKS